MSEQNPHIGLMILISEIDYHGKDRMNLRVSKSCNVR
jgi:hypothetical protein